MPEYHTEEEGGAVSSGKDAEEEEVDHEKTVDRLKNTKKKLAKLDILLDKEAKAGVSEDLLLEQPDFFVLGMMTPKIDMLLNNPEQAEEVLKSLEVSAAQEAKSEDGELAASSEIEQVSMTLRASIQRMGSMRFQTGLKFQLSNSLDAIGKLILDLQGTPLSPATQKYVLMSKALLRVSCLSFFLSFISHLPLPLPIDSSFHQKRILYSMYQSPNLCSSSIDFV